MQLPFPFASSYDTTWVLILNPTQPISCHKNITIAIELFEQTLNIMMVDCINDRQWNQLKFYSSVDVHCVCHGNHSRFPYQELVDSNQLLGQHKHLNCLLTTTDYICSSPKEPSRPHTSWFFASSLCPCDVRSHSALYRMEMVIVWRSQCQCFLLYLLMLTMLVFKLVSISIS